MNVPIAIASIGYVLLMTLDQANVAATEDCHVGSYRLSGGGIVDVAPSDGDALRWTLWSGETGKLHPKPDSVWMSALGWTDRPDGKIISFSDCGGGNIFFNKERGRRIGFDVHDIFFESSGVKLVGRLMLAEGREQVPVVVLVHGSEHEPALDTYRLQRMFPAQGIGAFVYDKRGTGTSGGTYTQDFDVLATDAIAAMNEAKRLAGPAGGSSKCSIRDNIL